MLKQIESFKDRRVAMAQTYPGADNTATKNENLVLAGNQTPAIKLVASCFTERGITALTANRTESNGLLLY
jgi:sulfur relay (sulfurtransferase) complex TusBCD TusD component (DsrE family)